MKGNANQTEIDQTKVNIMGWEEEKSGVLEFFYQTLPLPFILAFEKLQVATREF
jgi:hypothetical protein